MANSDEELRVGPAIALGSQAVDTRKLKTASN